MEKKFQLDNVGDVNDGTTYEKAHERKLKWDEEDRLLDSDGERIIFRSAISLRYGDIFSLMAITLLKA